MNNIYATYEQAWMSTSQGKWVTEKLRYGQACMLEKEEKYYTELSNTMTTFNDNHNTPLSSVKIQEAVLKVMMEDEEESILDAYNIAADVFSHVYSS